MEKATISQLKNRLSAYLEKVRAGGTVLILDRDQPIARIERIEAADRPGDRIARLERAGLLRRPSRPPLSVESLPKPAPGASSGVLAALIEERREGR
jgi:antitoxin (DNA-binding transcriptional repressor) of toxin-antitoxin stability system